MLRIVQRTKKHGKRDNKVIFPSWGFGNNDDDEFCVIIS